MLGLGEHDRRIEGRGDVRVDEVERRARRDPGEQRLARDQLVDAVPADVGQGRRAGEADGPAGQHAQRRGTVLVGAVEEELEAEADPEEWPPGGDPGPDRLDQAAPAEAVHRRPGRADAGHDQGVGAAQRFGVADHDRLGPDHLEGPADADQVARAVVGDGDPDHWRVPLSDAMPVRRGSISQASRSARPSALNAASAR